MYLFRWINLESIILQMKDQQIIKINELIIPTIIK